MALDSTLNSSAGAVGTSNSLLMDSLQVEHAFFLLIWVLSEPGAHGMVPGLARAPALLTFDGFQMAEVGLQYVGPYHKRRDCSRRSHVRDGHLDHPAEELARAVLGVWSAHDNPLLLPGWKRRPVRGVYDVPLLLCRGQGGLPRGLRPPPCAYGLYV